MSATDNNFDMLAPKHLELIMRPGGLETAQPNSPKPAIRAYVMQLAAIYKEYFDPTFDDSCPHCLNRMIEYFRRRRQKKVTDDMGRRKRAEMIPAADRNDILDTGIVTLARPLHTDEAMHYLTIIWQTHIDPTFRGDCDKCFATVLKEMRAMLPFLKELRENEGLLKSLE